MSGYVLGGYGATIVILAVYSLRTLARGRALTGQLKRKR